MNSLTKLKRTQPMKRTVTRATLGMGAAFAALLGVSQIGEVLPELDQQGLAQTLRQTAWDRALKGQSSAGSWPWDNVTSNLSLTLSGKASKVRRLGLSASLRGPSGSPASPVAAAHQLPGASKQAGHASRTSIEGDIALGDVGPDAMTIGDRITFTANDGATCVYRVTRQRVVDPHLASDEAGRAAGQSGLFQCGPLESLIRQATQIKTDQSANAKVPANEQRNL